MTTLGFSDSRNVPELSSSSNGSIGHPTSFNFDFASFYVISQSISRFSKGLVFIFLSSPLLGRVKRETTYVVFVISCDSRIDCDLVRLLANLSVILM